MGTFEQDYRKALAAATHISAKKHSKDADCLPHLDAKGDCKVCHVYRGDIACQHCGGRSFHVKGCAYYSRRKFAKG